MEMYCNSLNCRFSHTHTTFSHKCGLCSEYGHGAMECNNILNMKKLLTHIQKEIPKEQQCNCRFGKFHTIEGHKCKSCNTYGHMYYNCDKITCIAPQDDDDNIDSETLKIIESRMSDVDGKIYMLLYTGMGCMYYAKRNYIGDKISLFFMHSDAWGQYGYESSDIPKLKEFLNGYKPLNKASDIIFS